MYRSFTRETKHHVAEKEHALRLIRCGFLLPAAEAMASQPEDDPFTTTMRSFSTSPASMSEAELDGARASPKPQPEAHLATEPAPTKRESPVALSDSMIRALVSAAENSDDSMQSVCIQALMEIGKLVSIHYAAVTDGTAVIDIERLLNSSALSILLLCFKDGPTELCPAMTHVLMYLANSPSTRQFLLPQADVEVRRRFVAAIKLTRFRPSSSALQNHMLYTRTGLT